MKGNRFASHPLPFRDPPAASLQPFFSSVAPTRHHFNDILGNTHKRLPSRLSFFFFFLSFLFSSLYGYTHSIWKFPGEGSNWICSCRLVRQLQQWQILQPLSEARVRASILMDTSWVLNLLSHNGNSILLSFFFFFFLPVFPSAPPGLNPLALSPGHSARESRTSWLTRDS